jgi:hypothetical protein
MFIWIVSSLSAAWMRLAYTDRNFTADPAFVDCQGLTCTEAALLHAAFARLSTNGAQSLRRPEQRSVTASLQLHPQI